MPTGTTIIVLIKLSTAGRRRTSIQALSRKLRRPIRYPTQSCRSWNWPSRISTATNSCRSWNCARRRKASTYRHTLCQPSGSVLIRKNSRRTTLPTPYLCRSTSRAHRKTPPKSPTNAPPNLAGPGHHAASSICRMSRRDPDWAEDPPSTHSP